VSQFYSLCIYVLFPDSRQFVSGKIEKLNMQPLLSLQTGHRIYTVNVRFRHAIIPTLLKQSPGSTIVWDPLLGCLALELTKSRPLWQRLWSRAIISNLRYTRGMDTQNPLELSNQSITYLGLRTKAPRQTLQISRDVRTRKVPRSWTILGRTSNFRRSLDFI
jgi:hypothetical protein